MVKLSDGSCFALKEASCFLSLLMIGIRCAFDPNHLDRHLSWNAQVFGKVNIAHPTLPDELQKSVMSKLESFEWHILTSVIQRVASNTKEHVRMSTKIL